MIFWTFATAYVQYEGSRLKSVGLALAVGWHGDPSQRKEWCRERELPGLKCKSSEMVTINVKVEGS